MKTLEQELQHYKFLSTVLLIAFFICLIMGSEKNKELIKNEETISNLFNSCNIKK